jgi:predicted aspartyl protease
MKPIDTQTSKDETVGRILTPVTIENYDDVVMAARGALAAGATRKVEVAEAWIDTGASTLCLPASLIQELGLRPLHKKQSRTAAGVGEVTVFSTVRLTILGRDTEVRVTELPDGAPVLVGQIPLEDLDLVPYPQENRLMPNPAHGGEWSIDLY